MAHNGNEVSNAFHGTFNTCRIFVKLLVSLEYLMDYIHCGRCLS